MVSDDMLTVGSTNVDFRSFEHNFEVNAFIYDVNTALEMKEIFLQDQRESTQIFWEELGEAFVETKSGRVYCPFVGSIAVARKIEKFTLPYTLLSTKYGFSSKLLSFPCSNTNKPP